MSKKNLLVIVVALFVLLVAAVSYCFILNSELKSTRLEEIEAQKQKELSVTEEQNKIKYLELCTKDWQNYSYEKDEIISTFEEGCNNAANTLDEFGKCLEENIQKIGGFREKDEFIKTCMDKYMSY